MMKTTPAGEPSDLTDLVDYPRETLDIELKEWIDLNDRVAQAKLAKHIAELANHGGGYLLFGFCDDQSIAPTRPSDLLRFSRDEFSGIIKRYLTPLAYRSALDPDDHALAAHRRRRRPAEARD